MPEEVSSQNKFFILHIALEKNRVFQPKKKKNYLAIFLSLIFILYIT